MTDEEYLRSLVGQTLKDGNGCEWEIVSADKMRKSAIVGILKSGFARTWDINGFYVDGSYRPSNLILPPRPARVTHIWVNVYPEFIASSYKSKSDADNVATVKRISCRKLEINIKTGFIKDVTDDPPTP